MPRKYRRISPKDDAARAKPAQEDLEFALGYPTGALQKLTDTLSHTGEASRFMGWCHSVASWPPYDVNRAQVSRFIESQYRIKDAIVAVS